MLETCGACSLRSCSHAAQLAPYAKASIMASTGQMSDTRCDKAAGQGRSQPAAAGECVLWERTIDASVSKATASSAVAVSLAASSLPVATSIGAAPSPKAVATSRRLPSLGGDPEDDIVVLRKRVAAGCWPLSPGESGDALAAAAGRPLDRA